MRAAPEREGEGDRRVGVGDVEGTLLRLTAVGHTQVGGAHVVLGRGGAPSLSGWYWVDQGVVRA